jgi:hypothetical protein
MAAFGVVLMGRTRTPEELMSRTRILGLVVLLILVVPLLASTALAGAKGCGTLGAPGPSALINASYWQ